MKHEKLWLTIAILTLIALLLFDLLLLDGIKQFFGFAV
jgi:hypothetical protein